MRRSGKLSVRARASVPMGAHTVPCMGYGYVCAYADARTRVRVFTLACIGLPQARQLGPAGASRTFIGGYAQVHSRPPAPRSAPACSSCL